jgi:hypothetical protein
MSKVAQDRPHSVSGFRALKFQGQCGRQRFPWRLQLFFGGLQERGPDIGGKRLLRAAVAGRRKGPEALARIQDFGDEVHRPCLGEQVAVRAGRAGSRKQRAPP